MVHSCWAPSFIDRYSLRCQSTSGHPVARAESEHLAIPEPVDPRASRDAGPPGTWGRRNGRDPEVRPEPVASVDVADRAVQTWSA